MALRLVARNDSPDPATSASNEHALVLLYGELDLATAPQLSQQLAKFAHRNIRHVAMDISKLDFMDSSGLALFVAEHERVVALGGELIILSPGLQVRRLLEATGLDQYFNVRPRIVRGTS